MNLAPIRHRELWGERAGRRVPTASHPRIQYLAFTGPELYGAFYVEFDERRSFLI